MPRSRLVVILVIAFFVTLLLLSMFQVIGRGGVLIHLCPDHA